MKCSENDGKVINYVDALDDFHVHCELNNGTVIHADKLPFELNQTR
jgi:hypothetical protein